MLHINKLLEQRKNILNQSVTRQIYSFYLDFEQVDKMRSRSLTYQNLGGLGQKGSNFNMK